MSIISNVKSTVSRRPTALRVIAAVIALALIVLLLTGANDLLGNPVSYLLAKTNSEKYVAEKYGGEGYAVKSVSYSFKFKNYLALAEKPGSEDCRFTVYCGMDGKPDGDNYDIYVAGGENTRGRIEESYRKLADGIFESPAFTYSSETCYGTIVFKGDGEKEDEYDFGLSRDILKPDADYDVRELGRQAGLLTVYIDTEDLTAEFAAEALLKIKSLSDLGMVPFYAVDLTLRNSAHEYYPLGVVHAADIYEEGLAERAADLHQKEQARLDELDKKHSKSV